MFGGFCVWWGLGFGSVLLFLCCFLIIIVLILSVYFNFDCFLFIIFTQSGCFGFVGFYLFLWLIGLLVIISARNVSCHISNTPDAQPSAQSPSPPSSARCRWWFSRPLLGTGVCGRAGEFRKYPRTEGIFVLS